MSFEPGLMSYLLLLAIVLLPFIWGTLTYNRFVRLRQHIRESWSDIDVQLKRRYDLIPNLVSTVKGYAAHEREVLEKVVELRGKARQSQGGPASQAEDESALQIGLKRLFALAESYPVLKADQTFGELQRELANTEDRIAASRRFYNGNVRELNALRESFPASVIASRLAIQPEEYFQLDSEAERVVPRVQW
jgi:LemA protein